MNGMKFLKAEGKQFKKINIQILIVLNVILQLASI